MHPLEVQGLSKRYGAVAALAAFDLEVDYGEVVGLIGPNGAGKTTAMRAILGLIAPDEGAVRLDGVVLEGVARSNRIGALIDRPAVYPHLSGMENLSIAATALNLEAKAARQACSRLISELGLESVAGRSTRTYSTGLRQRLGIALALLGDARVVILDEPAIGLDPEGISLVRRVVRELAAGGRAVLLSSHMLDEIEHACDRVVILVGGKVVAQGKPGDLAGAGTDLMVGFASQDEADRAGTSLIGARIEFIASGRRLVLTGRGTDGPAIGELLAAHHLFPAELTAITPKLEDVFFEITRAVDEINR